MKQCLHLRCFWVILQIVHVAVQPGAVVQVQYILIHLINLICNDELALWPYCLCMLLQLKGELNARGLNFPELSVNLAGSGFRQVLLCWIAPDTTLLACMAV